MANNQYEKEDINIVKLYGKQATLSKQDFLSTYKVSEKGLSSKHAEFNLNKYGSNEIKQAKPKNGTTIFLKVYLHHLTVF